jgi:hypothetical protein
MALRRLTPGMMVHYVMAKHLKRALEKGSQVMAHDWCDNLNLLLWMLFVGSIASPGRPEHSYFINHLKETGLSIGVLSLGGFKLALKNIVWSETFFASQSLNVWGEINGDGFK